MIDDYILLNSVFIRKKTIHKEVIIRNSKKDTENKKSGGGDFSRRIYDRYTRQFIYSL